MCLHHCWLLRGFSDSQSWAQQSEIKIQTKRSSDAGRVSAGFGEKRRRPGGLGALLWRACGQGEECLAPEPEDPASPPASCPSAPSLREQHSTARWRPEWLTTTPPLTSQVNLPSRCTPGPIPSPGTDHSLPPSFWTTEAAELHLSLEYRV